MTDLLSFTKKVTIVATGCALVGCSSPIRVKIECPDGTGFLAWALETDTDADLIKHYCPRIVRARAQETSHGE